MTKNIISHASQNVLSLEHQKLRILIILRFLKQKPYDIKRSVNHQLSQCRPTRQQTMIY